MFKKHKFGQYDKIKAQMMKEEGNNSEIDLNDFSIDKEFSRVVEFAKKTLRNWRRLIWMERKAKRMRKVGDNLWGTYQK